MKFIKRIVLSTVILMSLYSTSIAQESTAPQDSLTFVQLQFSKYASIFQLANTFNDPIVARMALYEMLMITNNQPAILDSLALSYYSGRMYTSSALVSQENLKIDPDNQVALEIAAISFQNLSILDRSLEYYEKLYLKNNNTNTLYQMAFLQYQLKKYQEATATIEILLLRTDVDEIMMSFNKIDNTAQEVSMRAALLNLKGIVAIDQGFKEEAKIYFLEAIKSSPGFELAQLNLKNASKKEEK
ncbi:MAG: hypothetical protein OCD76_21025 [Reichenbachiella sp.]